MKSVSTLPDLFACLEGKDTIIVEGPRCSGKDHLIREFLQRNPAFSSYEVLKPRKQFLAQGVSGNLSNLPADLDIQQSHLWTLDVFRQLRPKVIVNRGMLSSYHFDGPHSERLAMWCRMVKDLDAVVVLVLPVQRIHSKRIAAAGRVSEATSISVEKAGILRAATESDLGDRLIHLAEVS